LLLGRLVVNRNLCLVADAGRRSSLDRAKANAALAKIFPIMVAMMLAIVMVRVRSFPAMSMVMLTAPLGLVGTVPVLLLFHQPFGFNAILGLIGLATDF
jgi:multidrug efflux pump subunit AcrB